MPRPSLRIFRIPTGRRRKRLYTMILAVLTLLTFITPFYVIYKPPHLLIRYFAHRWPDVLWHVPTQEKIVALTIDDAPSAQTPQILETLAENGAQATFFVIGAQVFGREETLKDIVRGGNELGNHAMHDEPARALKMPALVAELDQVNALINATYASLALSPPPRRYFRPGSGFFSSKMREVIAGLGYKMVLGSVYPHDPQISYARVNAAHILSMVRPGSIVICHDRRTWTDGMLRIVLPELKKRGYRVTTVTGLLDSHGIDQQSHS